jgi:hypothetical protein
VTDRPDVHAYDLHPARMHDVLAEADLLVADTATMVTEAALLCTPAVRASSFAGEDDFGNFVELADAGLAESYADPERAADRAVELAGDPHAVARWTGRLHAYLPELVDLTALIVALADRGGDAARVPGLSRSAAPAADPAGQPLSDR